MQLCAKTGIGVLDVTDELERWRGLETRPAVAGHGEPPGGCPTVPDGSFVTASLDASPQAERASVHDWFEEAHSLPAEEGPFKDDDVNDVDDNEPGFGGAFTTRSP